MTRLPARRCVGPPATPRTSSIRGGRNWVKDGKVTLIRPPTVDECFRLLDNGTVDGVVEAELVGRASIVSLGLGDRVLVIDQPVALTTLHVLISKSHPHARTILYYMNSSLTKLRENGEYDRIIERHLARVLGSPGGHAEPNDWCHPSGSPARDRFSGSTGSSPSTAAPPAPKAKIEPKKGAQ